MQEGSLIIMVKALCTETIQLLQERGFKRWPVPDPDSIHMITAMQDVTDVSPLFPVGIQIDTFPDLAREGYWFNPDYFREIKPPSIDFEKILEKEPEEVII